MVHTALKSLGLLLLTAGTAHASTEWDWDEEFSQRHWRTASLQWAQDIHPDHPTFEQLEMYVDPPAEELWCHYEGKPTQDDFDIHTALLDDWLHYYLEIPPEEPLPQYLPAFPPECIK